MRPLSLSMLPLALATLTLGGCANFNDILPLSRLLGQEATVHSASASASDDQSALWPQARWWETFADPQLNALIDEALANSPNLRLAQARVRQAEALAGVSDAARYPALDGNASSTRQRYSENSLIPPPLAGTTQTDNRLALNLTYDLDFWGRHEAEYRAALGEAKASQVDAQAARLLLAANLTRAYVQLDRAYRLQALAEDTRRQREETLKLVAGRVAVGLDSAVELKQAEAAVAAARGDKEAAAEQIALYGHQIAALLGATPDRAASLKSPALGATASAALPATLPADLLGHRPDVVAQRWRVEALTGRIDAAKAQFYPNINLMAFVGTQALGFDHLFDSGSRALGFGPAISLPLFDAGRLRSNLKAKTADYDAGVEQYNLLVREAARDVADQITSLNAIARQQKEQDAALAGFQEAWRLARLRYDKGLTNYLTVLAAEGQWLAQRRIEVDLKTRQLDTRVGLIRALGGGLPLDTPAPHNANAPHTSPSPDSAQQG